MEAQLGAALQGAMEVLPRHHMDGEVLPPQHHMGEPHQKVETGIVPSGTPMFQSRTMPLVSIPEDVSTSDPVAPNPAVPIAAVAAETHQDAEEEEEEERSFESASSRVSGMSNISSVMKGMKNRTLYQDFREYTRVVREMLRLNRKEQRGLRWFLREMRDNIDGAGAQEPIAFDQTDIDVTEDMLRKLKEKREAIKLHYQKKRELVVSDLMNLERVLQVRSAKLAKLMKPEYGTIMSESSEFAEYWINVAREMEGDIKDLRSEAGGGLEDLKRHVKM